MRGDIDAINQILDVVLICVCLPTPSLQRERERVRESERERMPRGPTYENAQADEKRIL